MARRRQEDEQQHRRKSSGTIIREGQLQVQPLLIGIRQLLASMCSSAQTIDAGRWRMLAKERLVFKIAHY
jgi:hypothetical protein